METPSERIERELIAAFPSETSRLDNAAAAFEAGKAKLFDNQGRAVYGEQLHAEKQAALFAELDRVGAAVTAAAEAEIERQRAELVKLAGADAWDSLTAAEREKAGARQPFISEDARHNRPDQIVKQARAALVSNDRAAVYLWARGIRRRVDAGQRVDPELSAVLRDLESVFSDPEERQRKQQAIEQRISSAQVLAGRVRLTRQTLDGTLARAAGDQRAYFASRF